MPHNRPRRLGQSKTERHRQEYRLIQPLCEMCLKRNPPRVRVWTELDHRIALCNGGKDFDEDPGQRQGLCRECHGEKTANERGYTLRPRAGADVNGLPLDPNHWWHRKPG